MTQSYTTLEQSKKLVELGFDPKTADMHWRFDCFEYKPYIGLPKYQTVAIKDMEVTIPCWSLAALLQQLPTEIKTSERSMDCYDLKIRIYTRENVKLYQIAYGNNQGLSGEWHDMINSGEKENLIDAVYQMIVWLFKNGYKKGETK